MVTVNRALPEVAAAGLLTTPAAAMIPPADSLLKYDTPVLVSRNTEKRSPKVRTSLRGRGVGKLRGGQDRSPSVEDGESPGTEAEATGSKANWDRGRRVGERY